MTTWRSLPGLQPVFIVGQEFVFALIWKEEMMESINLSFNFINCCPHQRQIMNETNAFLKE